MNSMNSATFTGVSDSKMLDMRDNTIPEKTLTERVSISRQKRNAKDIANDILSIKKSTEIISAFCYFKRMPSNLFVSCYLRNFIFQVKLACAFLRWIVYFYPERTALINHVMFLAKALCFSFCLTELDSRLFLCSGLSSEQRDVTRLLDSCFSLLLPSILNTALHALSTQFYARSSYCAQESNQG